MKFNIKPWLAAAKPWSIPFVIAFVVFVVILTPAKLVAFIATNTVQGLSIQGVSGSAWNGKAGSVVVQVYGNHYALGKLDWQLNPLSLLILRPSMHIETKLNRQTLTADVTKTWGSGVKLKNLEANGSIALLHHWMPKELNGNISAVIDELEVSGSDIHALKGNVTWQPAAWNGDDGLFNLGGMVAELNLSDSGDVNAKIFDIAGDLKVDGQYIARTNGNYEFSADLIPRDGLDSQIEQALELMAQPLDEGGFRLKFTGEL